MRRIVFYIGTLLLLSGSAFCEESAPFYLWLEPEWFNGVSGHFAYWPGPDSAKKAVGHWGVAGPGISAEWSQGGESEWNSMAAGADETNAECNRIINIPALGRYRIWVRYVDHRKLTEQFSIIVEKNNKKIVEGDFGLNDVVPINDEYQLYWGFSFGWGFIEGDIPGGQVLLKIVVNKPAQAWRQIDAICITDDLNWMPSGREKPGFAYFSTFNIKTGSVGQVRGNSKSFSADSILKRPTIAGRDFSMWTGISVNKNFWDNQDVNNLSVYDVLFENGCGRDIKEDFKKQFNGDRNLPIVSWKNLLPGVYLGESPDLSSDSSLRKWLEKTKTPFYIMTNYANPRYDEKTGPATYQALTGPLADQFLGYIHGEAIGTVGVSAGDVQSGKNRRQYIDIWGANLVKSQTDAWSKFYKTDVSSGHIKKSIPCLSCESITFAHLFHELGMDIVGYEIDATNIHVPMRIAFERGAARQYNGAWINYASGNWGDACNYFTQEPIVPRGAKCWFHSKYAITDGVSIAWYRRLYYLNYLSGASAIYWEQSLTNQWIKPGPGNHPVQLSPFGRATEDFQAFVDRLPDRGESYTPIAFLLSYGHGYDSVSYTCKMLNCFSLDDNDVEIRELFNVAWHPTAILEGMPQAPDVQSMPSGIYGNIFDVLVDRSRRASIITNYPVVWAAGDVSFDNTWMSVLQDYLRKGGTLVINVEAVKKNKNLLKIAGIELKNKTKVFKKWSIDGQNFYSCVDYNVEMITSTATKPQIIAVSDDGTPIIIRNQIGDGSVILTLVPHMVCMDERAHPALPYLMNLITDKILPFEICTTAGKSLSGEVMYLVNKTKDGWLVGLFNNQGIDKTQNGIARVDRSKAADIEIQTLLQIKSAKEYTQPRELKIEKSGEKFTVKIRVEPGDVQVVYFIAD